MTKVKVTIRGQRFVTNTSCVSHNLKANKGNLIKLYRKIMQNEVCHTQNLGSYHQGQGHNQRSKVCQLTNYVSAITQKSVKGI